MKKPFRIICLLLVGGVIVFAAIKGAVAQSRTQSIIDVINQNANAAKHSVQILTYKNGMSRTNFLASQYVAQLHKIDTSACPKKFQLAWLNYVQTWEVEAQQTPSMARANALAAAIGTVTHSSSLETVGTTGIERQINANDAITHAWQNVEMVALEYDVRIKYQ
ncbi:MAG TPA: hypothetical protein VGH42_12530 [Verrucomicrobiae bacterium]|jgi:hypothetical protein